MPANGRFRVYRSTDNGDSWHALSNGFPDAKSYDMVLRGSMDVDHLDPCGVYLGTTSGRLFLSHDGGDHWISPDGVFPRVLCVAAFVNR